jgi:hypothetical protein
MDRELPQVILGWLLSWANCPDRGLNGGQRARASAARKAASDGTAVLLSATKQDLAEALESAVGQFAKLCPDVDEERRLRMVARLARIFEGDRLHLLVDVDSAPPEIG